MRDQKKKSKEPGHKPSPETNSSSSRVSIFRSSLESNCIWFTTLEHHSTRIRAAWPSPSPVVGSAACVCVALAHLVVRNTDTKKTGGQNKGTDRVDFPVGFNLFRAKAKVSESKIKAAQEPNNFQTGHDTHETTNRSG